MKNFKLALFEKATKKVYKWKDLVNVNPWLLWSIIVSNENNELRQDYEILLFTWFQDKNKEDIYEWDSIAFWVQLLDWRHDTYSWLVIYDEDRASFFVELDNWDMISLDALFNSEKYKEEFKKLWIEKVNWIEEEYLYHKK